MNARDPDTVEQRNGITGTIELPEGTVPGIVGREDWQKVQAILDGRALRPVHSKKSRHVWPRGGLAICGVCGAGMVLAHKPNHSAYLKCTRANRYSTEAVCAKPSPSITTDKLQHAVWPLVEAVLNRPELLWDRFESNEQQAHDEAELAHLQQGLTGVQTRRSRLLRSLEVLDDADLESIRDRLAELATESDELTQAVSSLERRIASRALQRERLSVWLEAEQTRIGEMDIAEKREAALRLGLRVRVFPTTAPERFVAEFGAVFPDTVSLFDGLDWSDVEPTPERRRVTAELEAEAIARADEAGLMAGFLEGSVPCEESLNHRRCTASSRRSALR